MSMTRKLQRSIRRANGDAPNARTDAERYVHPTIDVLLTDRELARAAAKPPLYVQRSAERMRSWKKRIAQRLNVPERVRIAFAQGVTPEPAVVARDIIDEGGDTVTVHEAFEMPRSLA